MGAHNYTELTIKKLYSLSGNICAFPTCKLELITKDEKINISEICHIEGEEENSPRYNPNLTKTQLDDYENLILLCRNHHKIIDDAEATYTVDDLKDLKRKHEEQNRDKDYKISDELARKIIQESLVQTNINSSTGTQIITQTGNITQNFGFPSNSEAKNLIEILFEQNFPKLREEAQKTAKENVEKFCQTFLSLAKSGLKPEDINKLSDPDFQVTLNTSLMQAGRKDEQELRENLSRLLIARLSNSDYNLRKIVYNEAIETIGKLTIDDMKIITLCFILRYTKQVDVKTFENLDKFLGNLSPFLDFNNTSAEFQHIVYANCGELDMISDWTFINSILSSYPDLMPLIVNSHLISLHGIPEDINSTLFTKITATDSRFNITTNLELENYLQIVEMPESTTNAIRTAFNTATSKAKEDLMKLIPTYKNIYSVVRSVSDTNLKHLSLTSVGIAIGAMYWERISGAQVDISIWIK